MAQSALVELLPGEVLDRIFVNLVYRGYYFHFEDVFSASLVCRAWLAPARRLVYGHWKIDSLEHLRRRLCSASVYPFARCRFLFLEIESSYLQRRAPHLMVANDAGRYLLPYAQELREALLYIRDWSDADDALAALVRQATYLRTLSIFQKPTDEAVDAWNAGTPIYYAEMPSLLQRDLATKQYLKHIFLSNISLSSTFDSISAQVAGPMIQFRLTHLTLMECIISNEDFARLLSSQVGSLWSLSLSRISGPTKDVFQDAVIDVAPYLTRLALDLLPFEQPSDFPPMELPSAMSDYSVNYRYFPSTLKDGTPFPKHSLMGSSGAILPHCTKLEYLRLRDPLALASSLEGLSRVRFFQVYISPYSVEPLNLPALRSRSLLPELEMLHIMWNDNRLQDLRLSISRESKDVPFMLRDFGRQHNLALSMVDEVTGYWDHLSSPAEVAAIWEM